MKIKPVCDPRSAFFDSVADKWDAWHDCQDQSGKLESLFEEFGIQKSESMLDVGCGTGNLTIPLLQRLGPAGRIIAIDISEQMIAQAKKKTGDPRVTWHHASANEIPVGSETIDRVLCFSVWPHVEDPDAATQEFYRVLRPGGYLHIFHLLSREQVNHIHGKAHPSVHHDRLVPAREIAGLLRKIRFHVLATADDETRYVITARKEGAPT